MSKTQQEIAAPKACNKFIPHIILAATAVLSTALAAFIIYAYKEGIFLNAASGTSKATFAIIAILSSLIVISVIASVIFKTAKNLAVFGFYAAVTAVVLTYLVLIEPIDFSIGESFTLSMLLLLGTTLILLAFTVCYVLFTYKQTRQSRLLCSRTDIRKVNNQATNPKQFDKKSEANTILAALIGCLFAIAALFSYYLRDKKDYVSFIWGISGFTIAAQMLMCVITCLLDAPKKVITTKWVTYCATFSALSVVCKIMGNAVSFIPALKFSPVYVPWVTAGIVLGPVGGMIAAGVGDVLGQLIMPSGFANINPIITAANMLFTLFPALLYRYSPIKKDWLNILIGMVMSTLFCTLGLSTFGQWLYYYRDMKYTAYLATKFFQPIIIGINYFLIMMLLPALKRARITNLRFVRISSQTRRQTTVK